jgi:hypothetical protein
MSREERRAYQRQMKSMERGPTLPPAAKARAERNAARRSARGPRTDAAAGTFSRRFLTRSILAAVIAGFLAFSLQWGEGMPRALYAGLIVAIVIFGLIAGFRILSRRARSAP